MQEIEVVIDPDGTTRIEVRGVGGTECRAVTADLEAALGDDVTAREFTAEAYQSAETTESTAEHRSRRS